MNNTVCNSLRKLSISLFIGCCLIIFLTGIFLTWSRSEQLESEALNQTVIVLSRSKAAAVKGQDKAALRSALRKLRDSADNLQIGYIGFFDERGRLLTSELYHPVRVDPEPLTDQRLTDRTERVLFPSVRELTIDRQTFREIDLPIDFRGEQVGLVRVGFVPAEENFLTVGFNRIYLLLGGLVIVIGLLLLIKFFADFDQQLEEKFKTRRASIENSYKKQIKQLEKQLESGPLSSSDFFQLLDFARRITGQLSSASLYDRLVAETAQIMEADDVVLFLQINSQSEVFQAVAGIKEGNPMDSSEIEKLKIYRGQGELGRVIELGQSHILNKPYGGAAVAGAIRYDQKTAGVLRVTEKISGELMNNRDKLKIRLISQLVGNIIKASLDRIDNR